jgi:hypothetical protein
MDQTRWLTVKPVASLDERSFTKGDPPQSSEVQFISKTFQQLQGDLQSSASTRSFI